MAKPEKDGASHGGEPAKPAATPFIRRRTGLLAVVLIVGALAFAAVQLYQHPGRMTGGTPTMPAVGGPFSLTDQNGKPVTEAGFKGKLMLVYFGYTFCPDVCPTALTEMGNAIEALGPAGDKVAPVFITVDPARDTPEHLKEYLAYFHPRFVGLTGTAEQVTAAAKAYRVYYAKAKTGAAGASDALDYLVDHTSIIYLMGPEGGLKAHFPHGTGADAMAKKIRELL
ncbi:MAG: SCO family protein [Rhodospirillales bacterium]|nr:SCO family protein [Rhodospirillales bacterium]MBI2977530.1 SCO family protein [Rhodospirillales bacterium]